MKTIKPASKAPARAHPIPIPATAPLLSFVPLPVPLVGTVVPVVCTPDLVEEADTEPNGNEVIGAADEVEDVDVLVADVVDGVAAFADDMGTHQ